MNALVVMPTYNEAASIERVIGAVLAADPRVEVLVVDDNSPDGTGDLVAAAQASQPRLHLLRRAGKQGLGAAYRVGFGWGILRGFDALVEMDADLSHPPDQVPALLDGLEHADVVIGSRYVPGGRTCDWDWRRKALSRGGNVYIRLALDMPLRDATSGMRAYRREVLEALPVHELVSNGYCFQVEMAHRSWQEGFILLEVPITFGEREAGQSKMDRRIVLEAIGRVTWWALNGGRRRARVVHPRSVLVGEL